MLLKWKEMFHRQVYTLLIRLIYLIELFLCYIYIFFSCMGKKDEEKQGQDISDLIIILKHFTSQVETDFHPKGY